MSNETIGDVQDQRDLKDVIDMNDLRDKLVSCMVLQLEKRDILVIRFKDETMTAEQLNHFVNQLKDNLGEHMPDAELRLLLVPDTLDFAVIRPPKG